MASIDPADDDFVAEDLLDRVRQAVMSCQERHGLPEPGSPCAQEMEREPEIAGQGWNNDPIRLAFGEAVPLLIAVQDHQRSAVVVLAAGTLGWGVPVLSRAALEAAARGHWIIDPDAGLLERGARAWTVKLSSWWWTAKEDVEDEAWWLLVGRRTMEVLAGAAARGLAFGLPRTGNTEASAPFVGSRMPNFSDLVEGLLPGRGREMYRSMSGFAHGGLHALDDGAVFDKAPGQAVGTVSYGLPYRRQVVFGVAATVILMSFAHELFGWTGWVDEAWITDMADLRPKVADLLELCRDDSDRP